MTTEEAGFNFLCACGGPTKVIDSRGMNGGIRRRRVCKKCNARWSTYERHEEATVPTLGVLGLLQTRVRHMREQLDQMESAILEAASPEAGPSEVLK